MMAIASDIGLEVIYGDTDRIFVSGVKDQSDLHNFMELCKEKLTGVEVEISNVFSKLLLEEKTLYWNNLRWEFFADCRN